MGSRDDGRPKGARGLARALGTTGALGIVGALGVGARRLLALDRQRGAYRRAWEDHALATLARLGLAAAEPGTRPIVGGAAGTIDEGGEPASDRPLLHLALGDSSVQGIGADRVEESYPARLAAAIGHATGREVALVNVSVSGGTAETVELAEIPQLRGLGLLGERLRPDLVTLSIGGNDVMNPAISPEDFAARIGRILDALPVPALVSSIPSFAPMAQESRAAEMSDALAGEAAARGCTVVDLRGLTLAYSLRTYALDYHAADMFHPNSAAYAIWAQLFLDAYTDAAGLPRADAGAAPRWGMLSTRVAESGA